jgi:putative ABC transport system ATP-binding protein/macrolide transport system ATP-binding/permease protein
MALIELRDIRKTYELAGTDGVEVLKGVTLDIREGALVALMGASGSGKSTLMNILGFLDTPTSGKYFFDGRDVSKLTSDERADLRNARIGFVFQNFNLLSRTSALQNVMLPLEYQRTRHRKSEDREWAAELLKRMGLEGRMDHAPNQLSGGQQQRVAIARALVNRPRILFADEPTGNLDSKTTVEILEMFRRLNREEGITIVIVTHDAEVCDYVDETIHIRDGLVVTGAY